MICGTCIARGQKGSIEFGTDMMLPALKLAHDPTSILKYGPIKDGSTYAYILKRFSRDGGTMPQGTIPHRIGFVQKYANSAYLNGDPLIIGEAIIVVTDAIYCPKQSTQSPLLLNSSDGNLTWNEFANDCKIILSRSESTKVAILCSNAQDLCMNTILLQRLLELLFPSCYHGRIFFVMFEKGDHSQYGLTVSMKSILHDLNHKVSNSEFIQSLIYFKNIGERNNSEQLRNSTYPPIGLIQRTNQLSEVTVLDLNGNKTFQSLPNGEFLIESMLSIKNSPFGDD
jgi:hypothetical protein